jgi:hypothetical protein
MALYPLFRFRFDAVDQEASAVNSVVAAAQKATEAASATAFQIAHRARTAIALNLQACSSSRDAMNQSREILDRISKKRKMSDDRADGDAAS